MARTEFYTFVHIDTFAMTCALSTVHPCAAVLDYTLQPCNCNCNIRCRLRHITGPDIGSQRPASGPQTLWADRAGRQQTTQQKQYQSDGSQRWRLVSLMSCGVKTTSCVARCSGVSSNQSEGKQKVRKTAIMPLGTCH